MMVKSEEQRAMVKRRSTISTPFKLAFLLSISLSLSLSLPYPHSSHLFLSTSNKTTTTAAASPREAAAHLLSLLGTKEQASAVNAKEARDYRSCLRFLVPFSPPSHRVSTAGGRGLLEERRRSPDEMVWWPPLPVMELARLAVDSGGEVGAVHRALDPTELPIPDVEGCHKDRCELTRTPYGRRFINKELNSYLAFLFDFITEQGPLVGLNVSLNRYDLFHGHLFLAADSGRLGILFHAKEYPAFDKETFPFNMGYCQTGSNLKYDDSMNLRNILWLAPLPSNTTKAWLAPGVLVVLDAHPGGIIFKDLIPEYVDFVRTIYEDDFGEVAVDVNYFNVANAESGEKIFIC